MKTYRVVGYDIDVSRRKYFQHIADYYFEKFTKNTHQSMGIISS